VKGHEDIAALTEGLPESPPPAWCPPMLAVLTDDRFSDPDWLFERMLDGERPLVFRDCDRARLMTSNRDKVNDTWPELAEALTDQPAREFVADGEVTREGAGS